MFDKKKFINKFENDKSYWYVHQSSILNNEERIIFELEFFRKLSGKIWNVKTQTAFRKELSKFNIADNRKKTKSNEQDLNALVRGIKSKMQTLGLLWVEEGSKISITSTGERFFRNQDFKEIVEHQLWKYIFYNPSMRKKIYHDTLLIPHAFLCQVLIEIEENYITHDEYILFVCKADTHEDLKVVLNEIRQWRKLDSTKQEEVLSRLKELKSSTRGNSLYQKIKTNKPYALGFFTNTTYLSNDDQEIRIIKNKKNIIKEKLEELKNNFSLIEFANVEDWIDFYGDYNKKYTSTEALEYYESKASNKKYKNKAISFYTKNQYLRNSLNKEEYEKKLDHEIRMHKYYAEFPDQIEPGSGLKLVENGFKYQTKEAGEIDLLCKNKNGFVIVELKRNKSSDKTIGQTLRYIGWVKENLCKDKKTNVRGIILSRSSEKKITFAINALPKNLISFYETPFDVTPKLIDHNKRN
tara:strand:+ start:1805 stop:3208 length:1404 start_codon:yes stop_codon:yes gene_type:complete